MSFSEIGKIRSIVPLLVPAETQLKSRRVLCVFAFCFLLSSFLPEPGNFTEVLIVISHPPYIQVYFKGVASITPLKIYE